MFPLNMSDIKAANALETPTTSAEPNQAAPVIPTQDVKPAGSGEVSEIEAYQAERAALLAAPDQPEVPAPAVTPPTPAPVVPAEPPPVEGELEVGDPPAGELPPEPGKPPRYRLKPVEAIEAVAFETRKQADRENKPISMKEAIAQAESLPQFKKTTPAPSQPL